MEILETNRLKVVEGFVALIKITFNIKFRKHNTSFNELYDYMPRLLVCPGGTAGAYGHGAGWKLPRGGGREAPLAWTP